MTMPIEAYSPRAALKSAFTKIKKFASLDYLLHCDCPKHKKNQTLKNQIRRHPERVALYLAAGAGILLVSYKLFTSDGGNNPNPHDGDENNPNPPAPPVPVNPVNPVVNPVESEPVVPGSPTPSPRPIRPVTPVDPEPEKPRPQPTPIEIIDIETPIEHQGEEIQIQVAQPANPIVRPQAMQIEEIAIEAPREYGLCVNFEEFAPEFADADLEHPINYLQVEAPQDDMSNDLLRSVTPESPEASQQESPRINPPKDKGEAVADQKDSNRIGNSFVDIPNVDDAFIENLSQPLRNLANLVKLESRISNTPNSIELLLLGAACNHALLTNNNDVINLLAQDHSRAARALMYYYYGLSAAKEQMFEEGTFLITHPRAEAIIEFLKKGAYERISSHFPASKEQHYGLDIQNMPTEKQTLLFGHVDRKMNSIFIKPESHGTNTFQDLVLHGISYVQSVGVKMQAALTGGPSHDDDPKFRKERVPLEVLKKFNILTQELVNRDVLAPDDANILNRNARAHGIAFMYAATQRINIDIQNAAINTLCQEFTAMIEDTKDFEHSNFRLGREVILTGPELEALITQDDFHRIIKHYFNV